MSPERQPSRRPERSLRPPPKPQRPSPAPRREEEEPTTRMEPDEIAAAGQPALLSAPLPSFEEATEADAVAQGVARPAAPLVISPPVLSPFARVDAFRAVEAPAPAPQPGRFAKLGAAKVGAALFAAGMLVGILSAVAVMRGGRAPTSQTVRSASVASVAARASAASLAGKMASAPALPPGPAAPASAPVAAPAAPAEPELASPPPVAAKKARGELASLPVPSFDAPSCQKLLGDGYYTPRNRQASQRETQLGNRQLVRGNVAQAHRAYCRAFVWDRKNADRHVNLAKLYLVRRDWEKAAQLGQSALALDPKNKKALGTLADALAALHQPEKARKAMLGAEGKSQPTPRELSTMVKRNLALAKRVARMNDFRSAERLYRRALLLEPEQTDAMRGVARCLLKVNEAQAAASWARRAEELKPTG